MGVCSSGALEARETHDGHAWGHLSLSWLAPALGSSHMQAHRCEEHLYIMLLGYAAISSGCGTHLFFSHRLWALSPNAGDGNGDRLRHSFPLLLPEVVGFPSFSNTGKVVSL